MYCLQTILGQPAGIRIKSMSNAKVTHNTVGYCPYAGIAAGWQDGTNGTSINNNTLPIFTIGYNHIHNYGLRILSDFGGIYLSTDDNLCFQKSPKTCWLLSLVHDNLVEAGSHYN